MELKVGDLVEFMSVPHGVNPPALEGKLGTISLVRKVLDGHVYSIWLNQGHVIPGVEYDQIALAD